MGGEVVDGTIGVEGGVEGEACADAGALHLSLSIHMSVDIVPCKDGLCAVLFGIEPSFVDGMGDAVAVDGGAGGFEIGVGAVEQLMPSSVVVLEGKEASEVCLEVAHDEG